MEMDGWMDIGRMRIQGGQNSKENDINLSLNWKEKDEKRQMYSDGWEKRIRVKKGGWPLYGWWRITRIFENWGRKGNGFMGIEKGGVL